jgi:hypothetical protein
MAAERISILEDPNAKTKPTLTTLLRIANACDVGLDVRFVSYKTVIDRSTETDAKSLEVPSFDEELGELEKSLDLGVIEARKPEQCRGQAMGSSVSGWMTLGGLYRGNRFSDSGFESALRETHCNYASLTIADLLTGTGPWGKDAIAVIPPDAQKSEVPYRGLQLVISRKPPASSATVNDTSLTSARTSKRRPNGRRSRHQRRTRTA